MYGPPVKGTSQQKAHLNFNGSNSSSTQKATVLESNLPLCLLRLVLSIEQQEAVNAVSEDMTSWLSTAQPAAFMVAIAVLYFCRLTAAGASLRLASQLTGSSGAIPSCFAPFMNRRLEYRFDANGVWYMGAHAAPDSANISAVVLVSTHFESTDRIEHRWVHSLEVVKMWQTKSYAKYGAPNTETQSMPIDLKFTAHIVQTDCDKFDEILHSPDLPSQALDIVRGLALMLMLALPSDDDFESVIPNAGLSGQSPALLSTSKHRDTQSKSQFRSSTHVKKLINETQAFVQLDNGETLPVRDETS